jgi:hypothetical protein
MTQQDFASWVATVKSQGVALNGTMYAYLGNCNIPLALSTLKVDWFVGFISFARYSAPPGCSSDGMAKPE